MKLKALEVQGFKTFPDKTKLSFTDGITAVVGPNGSGKSNISDAIRWVLGEQSAKALRCSKMEDVIFNGTQQRKKTGYAQVTLNIDNSDRTLQFDGDEVAVTRRYYRSGTSEYLINNTAVRLQDIHELFMDTGLGRDGYSMIGQGKIDSIVSTRGEDRREIFEEAAGISRFRYKKAEAERRLDKTEENLVRLRDNLVSLEKRVGPLKEQAEKAKAYLALAEEKRGLEIALWLKTLDKSSLQLRQQEDKITVAKAQYDSTEKDLNAIQSESESIYTQQNECTLAIESVRKQISKYEEKLSEKKSRISVKKNDILHNENSIARINGEITQMRELGMSIGREIKSKKKEIDKNKVLLSEKKAELEKYTKSLGALKSDESRSGEKFDEISAFIDELSSKAADARVKYMAASATIDDLSGRTDIVENNIKARKSQTGTLQDIISDYENMLNDCIERAKYLDSYTVQKQNAVQKSQNECDIIKAEVDKLVLDSEQLFRKAKMLEELEKNLEGFTYSVKLVMKQTNNGTLKGIHGPVSRVIRTPSEYNTAIETALGAAMQNIVTETDDDAKAAINYLKKHDGGRATFLPMSTIKGRDMNETGLESCEGFVGIASALCSCEECYKGILSNLLGRIVVAKDLDCAVKIARKYSYRFRIVTLDGQVVNTGGSLTGGSLAKNTGLLGRAAEIEKIRSQAQAVRSRADEKKKEWESAKERISADTEELERHKRDIAAVNEDKIKIEAEIKSRTAELDTVRYALSDAETERASIVNKLTEQKNIMDTSRKEFDEYRESIKKNEELLQVLTGSRNEYIRKRENINERIQELKIDVLALEKDISAAEAEIENASLRAENSDDKIAASEKEIDELTNANDNINQEISILEKECRELSESSASCTDDIWKQSEKRNELEKRSVQLRKDEREKTAERERINAELVRLEEQRANLQKQYDDIVSKLWEEYELTKREAEKTAIEIGDAPKAQRRLAELKQKIKSLGSVNVYAIEEYKEVSSDYEFLKVQVGDVEKSKSELLRLINDLTKQMREIFIERFNMINKNFSETFTELFGGGKASLSLSDPENVLTTGIDISVEPPGKIVSHIELLSGGEKALVAIALYFAIMKVSPSPFCVMDEIEAALDDVNVYRFAAYLRRMNDNTQFICITHRRGTMEEADVLYGVTMQDQGISKLLELRASELEQKLGMKA
ncbi:MAG: chromosome segregation protein SMC [Clostridia bacterium]|nr:chromosome segregation protein SMC [Clostridia bacterium]